MKVIIVGCGRLGADLAYRLSLRGLKVSVIDAVPESFHNLPPDFDGQMFEGEALDRDVLRRAGIEHADALAAVTQSDVLNVALGHIAREIYHIPQVIVRNYEPQYLPLIETFGLQFISSTSWGSQRIEELIYHQEARTVFSAGNGEVEIYEIIIPAFWHGKPLSQLMLQSGCMAIAITRAGRAFLPLVETQLEKGDILHISATFDGIESLRKTLLINEAEVSK